MEARAILIGKGNVGSCFLQLLIENADKFLREFDLNFKIVAICEIDGALMDEHGLNLKEIVQKGDRFRELPTWKKGITAKEILFTQKLDFCIETTPTNAETGEPALTHILKSLERGIDVVASNKGPFYLEYEKIKNLAEEKGCLVKYESTVASCVPALSVKQSLISNNILSIRAILNGTCNYILSRMSSEGVSFDIALKEAQELGYAEADPTLDIEGYDAAGKIVILANELLGWSKTIKDVEIKGITNITPQALELAKSDGFIIKHLAIAENNRLVVEPRLIEVDSPLNIGGTLNVIELQTKHAGPIVLMGRGAGGFEAASGLLNDVVNIAKIRQRQAKSD